MEATTKTTLTLLDWFNGTEYLLSLGFTKDEILKAITDSGNDVRSLTDEKGFSSIPQHIKRYEVFQEKGYRYFVELYHPNGGDWKKTEWRTGIGIRVPAQYQGLRHSEILFALFSNKWDWFKSFTKDQTIEKKIFLFDLPISKIPAEYADTPLKELRKEFIIKKELQTKSLWSIYEIRNKDSEIYLQTENGSLYVPIKALINSDFSLIEERMRTYFGWYHKVDLSGYTLNHRGRTETQYLLDQEEEKNKALSALTSKKALQLKKYLKQK